MNPELPQVRQNPEAMPQIPGTAEYFPDGSVSSPEINKPSYEQQVAPAAEGIAAPTQTITQILTPAPLPTPQPVQPDPVLAGAPSVAADDDLIEKEWVDKVKKIIALTRGKPYEQAKAIAALQADYLKKRHNRQLGEVDG